MFLMKWKCRIFRFAPISILVAHAFQGFSQGFDTTSFIFSEPDTQEKADSLNEWAYSEMRKNPNRALLFASKSLKVSNSINYKRGIGDAYSRLGYYYLSRDLDSSEYFYNKSLKNRSEYGQLDGVASCYNSLALIDRRKGDLVGALDQYENALEISIDAKTRITILKNRSAVYRDLGDLAQAYDDIILSLNALGSDSNSRFAANSYIQLGTILTRQSLYEEAEDSFIKARKIFQKKSDMIGLAKVELNLGNVARYKQQYEDALSHFQDAILILEDQGDIRGVAGGWNSIGQLYLDLEDYSGAKVSLTKSRHFADQAGDLLLYSRATYLLGQVSFSKSDFNKAIEHYQEAENIADSIGSLELQLDISENLANSYVEMSKWKEASLNFSRHLELRDSIDLDHHELNQLQRLYEREKSLAHKAKMEAALYASNSKKRQVVIWALSGVTVLLLIVGFLIIISIRQKQRRKLSEKQQKITKQQKELLEASYDELLSTLELKSISAVLEAQDQERRRIAQDLHDRLGSMLSMIKIHFENVEEEIARFKNQTEKDYSQAINLLDKATEEVRQIAHNLVSGPLKKFGLEAGLRELCKAVGNASGISVELQCLHLEQRLNFDFEVSIYRIIQELLANVMKHSNASVVSVQVIRLNGDLSVMVVDDGRGFDPEGSRKKPGMGLKNVKSRVEGLGGTIEVDSNKGNGTSISIQISLKSHENDQGFVGG